MSSVKDADRFLSLLATQLNETYGEEFEKIRDDISLEELLLDSLENLPDCPLREYLQKDLATHCQSLRKHLNDGTSVPSEASTDCKIKKWACTAVTIDNIESALQNIDTEKENADKVIILDLYRKLFVGSVWNDGMGLSLIMNHWSEYLISFCSSLEIIDSINFSLLSLPSDHTLISSLDFFVKLFTFLTDVQETTPPSFLDTLLSLLTFIHFTYQSIKPLSHDLQRRYDSQLPSLMSVYIKLNVIQKEKTSCLFLSKLSDLLQTFAGKKIGLKSLLLAKLSLPKQDGVFSLLTKSLMANLHFTSKVDPSLYLCCICCIHVISEEGSEVDKGSVTEQFDKITVPATLTRFLWDTHSNTCQLLSLREGWSSYQTRKHLLYNLNTFQREILYKMVCGSQCAEVASSSSGNQTETQCGQTLYYIDVSGGDSAEERASPNASHSLNKESITDTSNDNTVPMETDSQTKDNKEFLNEVENMQEKDTQDSLLVTPVTLATPKTSRRSSNSKKKRILLRSIRKSFTPPSSKFHSKISPKLLRSAVKKRILSNK